MKNLEYLPVEILDPLLTNNINSMEELKAMSDKELYRIEGIGEKRVVYIRLFTGQITLDDMVEVIRAKKFLIQCRVAEKGYDLEDFFEKESFEAGRKYERMAIEKQLRE